MATAWCLTPVEERPPRTPQPPARGGTGVRPGRLAGALGGAAGRTLGPWRVAHATTQPRGPWTVEGHVTGDRTGGLPQTDAPLAQAERRVSWDSLLALVCECSPNSGTRPRSHRGSFVMPACAAHTPCAANCHRRYDRGQSKANRLRVRKRLCPLHVSLSCGTIAARGHGGT